MFETWLKSDLQKTITVHQLSGNLFSGDDEANLIGVEIMDGGQPAEITGGVTGYVIRADNKTVVIGYDEEAETQIVGLDDNKAWIILPASAYIVPGRVSIVIKVGTTTVGACTAYVCQSTTETQIDPGSVVPDISTLLGYIADCIAATDEAENVNITMTSANDVVTIVTTDRSGTQTTVTIPAYAIATTTETQAIISEYGGGE